MKFHQLNLHPALMKGIDEAEFVECTPVQERTFHQVLDLSHDVTVQSQTGTGKTAAFLISIFEMFARSAGGAAVTVPEAAGGDAETPGAAPAAAAPSESAGTSGDTASSDIAGSGGATRPNRHKALVIVPTRELAVQVEEEAKLLGTHLHYRIGSVFGGVGYNQQERLLEEGADVIIGTPGRLLDFAGSRKLDFRQFDILVLDEADRMLDMGFLPDMRRIMRQVPPPNERHTMLFSATLSTRVKHLAWEFMNAPSEIEVAPERVTVDEITQELYHVSTSEKVRLLLGLLRREQPDNALIFTNMKSTAVEVAKRLSLNGLPAEFIMGDLPQRKRLALIEGIKHGSLRFLVATDVAARGLHIDDLDLVINYDIPEDPELYVHRIGRTARAGNTGKAISLACERYVYGLQAIEEFIGQKVPVVWAEETLYADDASAGMRFSSREGRGRTGRGGSAGSAHGSRGRGRGGHEGTSAGPRGGGRGARGTQGEQRAGTGRAGQPQSGKPRGGRPHGAPRGEQTSDAKDSRSRSAAPLDERVSYYRKKYGEDFKIVDSGSGNAGQQGSGARSSGRGRNAHGARQGDGARPAGGGPPADRARSAHGGRSSHSGRPAGSGNPAHGGKSLPAGRETGGRAGGSGANQNRGNGGRQHDGGSRGHSANGNPARNAATRNTPRDNAPARNPEPTQKPKNTSAQPEKKGGLFGKIRRMFGGS